MSIEFAGNLRSTNGKWWRPEKYARDTLTPAQIESSRNGHRVGRPPRSRDGISVR